MDTLLDILGVLAFVGAGALALFLRRAQQRIDDLETRARERDEEIGRLRSELERPQAPRPEKKPKPPSLRT